MRKILMTLRKSVIHVCENILLIDLKFVAMSAAVVLVSSFLFF